MVGTVDAAIAVYAAEVTKWRELRGLAKRALAQEMGYHRTYVTHIESGKQPPTKGFTEQAERVLRCGGALWSCWEAFCQARARQPKLAPRPAPNVVPLRELWSPEDLSHMLSISVRTLRAWRAEGFGPGWFRFGRWVRYDPNEVYRWLAEECEWCPAEPSRSEARQAHLRSVPS